MVYGGLYGVVLLLHLLAAVFIVGPLAVAGVLAPRALDAGREGLGQLRAAARTVRLYGLASVVVPLLGTAMIGLTGASRKWEFNDFWVSASYALYVVAALATVLVAGPALTKAASAVEAGEPTEIYKGRMQAAAGGAMLAWVVIVVLMVFKPGS